MDGDDESAASVVGREGAQETKTATTGDDEGTTKVLSASE